MNHTFFEQRLGPWLDGELNDADAREVAGHVLGCEACRMRVDETKRLSAAIRGMERHPMPADLKAKLMAGGDARMGSRTGSSSFKSRSWVIGSAAAAAGVVLLVLALRPGVDTGKQVAERPAQIAMDQGVTDSAQTEAIPPASSGISRTDLPKTPEESRPMAAAPPPPKVKASRPSPARARNESPQPSPAAAGAQSSDEAKSLVEPTAPAAPAPHDAMTRQAPASPITRFRTLLILKDPAAPALAPIVPASLDAVTSPGESPLAKERASNSAAGSVSSALGFRQEPAQSMTFLVRRDQDGHVQSVDPVGARLGSPELTQMVRDLLMASIFPKPGPADPTLVVVEVVTGETH